MGTTFARTTRSSVGATSPRSSMDFSVSSGADLDEVPAAQLKTILHSRRANLYYLEHCRVLVNGGLVEYVTDQGKQALY